MDPQKKGLSGLQPVIPNWLDLSHRPRCWSAHGKIFALMSVFACESEGIWGRVCSVNRGGFTRCILKKENNKQLPFWD